MAGFAYRDRCAVFTANHQQRLQTTNGFDTTMVLPDPQNVDQIFCSDPSRSGVPAIVEALFRHIQENVNARASMLA